MEKFLEALKKDETLAKEFFSKKTPEDLYAVAKPYIGEMTQEEFITKMQALAEVSKSAKEGGLSDDELTAASGGLSDTAFLMGFGMFNSAIQSSAALLQAKSEGKSWGEAGIAAGQAALTGAGQTGQMVAQNYMESQKAANANKN